MADVTSQQNQIDGDPGALRTHSRYYDGIAAAVVSTISNLRTVTDTLETSSDAVAAFADIARQVSTSLDEVDDRYRTLAAQLAYFAGEVERLQGESALVQSQARDADSERHSAVYARDNAYAELQWADSQDPRTADLIQDYNRYRDRVRELSDTVGNLDNQLEQLLDDWRAIANGCADAINEVISGSDLNDSWWDSFAAWVKNTLPDIETFLDILAIVLTVVAFLLVLTGVGAALAPALFAIARGIQLLSKLIMVMKIVTTTVQVVRGKESPGALLQIGVDFAIDKIGGKLVDGAADKLGGKLIAKYGEELAAKAGDKGFGKLAENIKQIDADGFDDWVTNVFTPTVNAPGGSSAFERFMVEGGMGDAKMTDWLSDKSDLVKSTLVMGMTNGQLNVGEGSPLAITLDAIAGPSTDLSGLAFDSLKLGEPTFKDFVENQIGSFDLASLMPVEPYRPSFDAMAASS